MKIRFIQIAMSMLFMYWTVLSAQEQSSPSLDEILDRHEAQLNAITSLEVSYTATYRNSDGSSSVESIRTWIAPSFEASTKQGTNQSDTIHDWWNNSTFGRMIGLDPRDTELPARSIAEARGLLYHEDMPMYRLFSWRTLRSYKFFTTDDDTSLRQICERSPETPILLRQQDRVVIRLAHSGTNPGDLPEVPPDTPIEVELDALHGYLIKRYTTTVKTEELNLTQTMEVREFSEVADGVFLPKRVDYTASTGGKTMMEQSSVFAYSHVNEPVDASKLKFVPNLLVSEFKSYGDDPSGFYLVGEGGTLGERYEDELTAMTVRNHRLGVGPGVLSHARRNSFVASFVCALLGVCIAGLLIKRRASRSMYLVPVGMFAAALAFVIFSPAAPHSLESMLATIASVPKAGDVAKPIIGVNLCTNLEEEIRFPGQVTLVEFWATWCSPCQPAMQKLNDVAKEKKDAWSSKVRLISISVDDDPKAAMERLDSKGWTHTETMIDRPLPDGESDGIAFPMHTSSRFGVSGVPTCILIDAQGRIVFRGHPMDIDIEVEIDKLLSSE